MDPAAIRYKNPGAMWPGSIATKWGSKDYVTLNDGQGNKIAIFSSFVNGTAAQFDLWRTSKNYRGKRLDQAIKTWSGGNHWQEYVQWLIAKVPGLRADTIIDDKLLSSPMGIEFVKWQAFHEAGKMMPTTADEYAQAQRLVFGGNVVNDDDDGTGGKLLPLIRIGDQGAAVSELQKLLGVKETGRYSQRSETEYALRLFQIRNGLDPDGICGPMTWDKLDPPEA